MADGLIRRIKVVRDDSPDEDGRWIELSHPRPSGAGWIAVEKIVADAIPEGHHLVAVE